MIIDPTETVWSQEYLTGNDYRGTWTGSINLLQGLNADVEYKLEIWAKSWGTGQGDSWLSNGGANYVANFHTDVTLPVELSTFTVMLGENGPQLNWMTQSEENNAGWNVYRGETEAAWQQQNVVQLNSALGLIEGAGTTSQPTYYQFEDIMPTQPDNSYWYWLESVDYSGVTELYGPVMVEIPAQDPGFIEAPEVPRAYGLQQNYPNPFNPSTEISFTLPKGGPVQLSVYNLKGQLLRTLIDGETMSGNQQHSVVWDGKDRYGNEVTSGIYLYKLRTLEKVYTKKMLLMK